MRFVLLAPALLLAASACRPPTTIDPHVAGPNGQQWQATFGKPAGAAFDVAMSVLTDSVYRIADARKDAGIIKTEGRKPSEVQRGASQMRSMLLSDEPIRLNVVIMPRGTDSSRVTITGEYLTGALIIPINGGDRRWPFVAGIGVAIEAAAKR